MTKDKDNTVQNKKEKKASNLNRENDIHNAHSSFEKLLDKYKDKLEFKQNYSKSTLSYKAFPPVKEALAKAAKRDRITQSDLIDRFLFAGLKREFPDIYEELMSRKDEMVFLPIGRPRKSNDDSGSSDPSFE